MKTVIPEWEYHYDLLDCPDFIADDAGGYQAKFDEWLFDKNNDHGYWRRYEFWDNEPQNSAVKPDPNGRDGVSYDVTAFIDWLNNYVLQESAEKVTLAEIIYKWPEAVRRERTKVTPLTLEEARDFERIYAENPVNREAWPRKMRDAFDSGTIKTLAEIENSNQNANQQRIEVMIKAGVPRIYF